MRIPTAELARSLGIGAGTGRNSVMVRTLVRLVRFDMARWEGDTLAVRRWVGPLPTHHLVRLSPALRHAHDRAVAGRAPQASRPA